jgi:hypothetical protein
MSCYLLGLLSADMGVQVAVHETPELDMDVCLQLMSWNKEAINRALKLSAPNKAARNCRALFHHLLPPAAASAMAAAASPGQGGSAAGSAGGSQQPGAPAPHPVAHPGCLLEQLAR